jgi:anthrone oxygenase-like protein
VVGYTVLSTLVLLLSGWLAGAETSSWALVQPAVARLDATPQIRWQQGTLRTFGRVMPILLPLTSVLIVATAIVAPTAATRVLWIIAAVAAAVLIAFTLTVNVPINKRTLTWDADHPPATWQVERRRWHTYQGLRALLLTVWFLCAVIATTVWPPHI